MQNNIINNIIVKCLHEAKIYNYTILIVVYLTTMKEFCKIIHGEKLALISLDDNIQVRTPISKWHKWDKKQKLMTDTELTNYKIVLTTCLADPKSFEHLVNVFRMVLN